MRNYSTCIVREPCPEMVNGITRAGLGMPDFSLAQIQHKAYVSALVQCGCDVITLPADPRFPDSVFVEDPALVFGETAVLARPGAASRLDEVRGLKSVLEKHFQVLEQITVPGTLDAGDVLEVGDHFYIGLSERTNPQGARQLIRILEQHGKTGSTITLQEYLHLKTGVAYLGNNTLLVAGELKRCPDFQKYNIIEVEPDEEYAANSIMINGKLIMPAGYPMATGAVESAGFNTLLVDTSEFKKLDGGLSCLSLRFMIKSFRPKA